MQAKILWSKQRARNNSESDPFDRSATYPSRVADP
jgi:hypothetical protein